MYFVCSVDPLVMQDTAIPKILPLILRDATLDFGQFLFQ